MSSPPIYPATELATKGDIDRLKARIDELAAEIREQQRTYVVTTVGAMTALTAIFSVVVGILV